jgi:hypothetical protein
MATAPKRKPKHGPTRRTSTHPKHGTPASGAGWRETLATATTKAKALIPASVHGAAAPSSGSAVLDDARSTLDRIKAALGSLAAKGLHSYLELDEWALRKAARVLASGAQKAARIALEAADSASAEIVSLANDAWQVAVGPLLLLALAYLAWKS